MGKSRKNWKKEIRRAEKALGIHKSKRRYSKINLTPVDTAPTPEKHGHVVLPSDAPPAAPRNGYKAPCRRPMTDAALDEFLNG